MKLYTFPISHFSEKAHWALDLSGLRYTLVPLVPGLHIATCKRLGVPRTQVPVLDTGDGLIQGSAAIIDQVASKRPELGLQRVDDDLEARIDKVVGEGLRRILYFRLMPYRSDVLTLWTGQAAWWTRPLLWVLWPVMKRGLTAGYKLNPERTAQAEEAFDALWNELETRLADHPWLGGEQFGRLDITLASLMAPLVQPAGHPFPWPEPHPAVEPYAARYRGRPLWTWVERAYAEQRQRA